MNAAEILRAAHAVGIAVTLDRDSLLLEAEAEPPRDLLQSIALYKPAILDLLRPGECGRTAEQWRTYFQERCRTEASANGLARKQAAQNALAAAVTEWLNERPAPSPAGRCAHCG